MGRKNKTLLQTLKAAVLAERLTELAGIQPNGYQLSRWYERRLGLAHGSQEKRSWDMFLKGQMPQHDKLAIIIDLEPKLRDLLNHPFWMIMDESSAHLDIHQVLQKEVYPANKLYLKVLWDDLSLMPVLDRITFLVAMIISPKSYEIWTAYITDWLAESYAQLILESLWKPFADFLLEVVMVRCESNQAFSPTRLCSSISAEKLQSWSIVSEDYGTYQSGQAPTAWAAWCSAIWRLNWSERELFMKYINNRAAFRSGDKTSPEKKIYKRVRDLRYKLLQKSPKLTICVLDRYV
ncbi:hypothetical protein KW841_03905 [Pseudomonas sp. PDM28]|uniref:hypothetical protein n=1 Tax=Pseudomonas sp. PDM28 TaxID=2854770 RepID=UPI001C44F087|nr:hypothetical protein [Pseudomonas sp. PDM28]MBV7551492.1 hypothetical protein [Pseudomonas sp. PDM28]